MIPEQRRRMGYGSQVEYVRWVEHGRHAVLPAERDVEVAGLKITDLTLSDLTEDLRSAVRITVPTQREPQVYLAAHVSSLNHITDPDYRTVMNSSRVTYADGMSVVLLARLAGARKVVRMGTTDVGLPMIEAVREGLGRAPRIAIVGGPDGLAEQAGSALTRMTPCEIVYATHGFHTDYAPVLGEVEHADPDILLVAMGMPREAMWVDTHLEGLRVPVVITCGGWLGFLVGDERRAPGVARRLGLEWVWRVAQDPGRLGPRYARGVLSTGRAVVAIAARRVRGRSGDPW